MELNSYHSNKDMTSLCAKRIYPLLNLVTQAPFLFSCMQKAGNHPGYGQALNLRALGDHLVTASLVPRA